MLNEGSLEKLVESQPATLGDVLDAVKEITKAVKDQVTETGKLREAQETLSSEISLSRKAGRF